MRIRFAAQPPIHDDPTPGPAEEADSANVFVGAYVGENHYVGVDFI